jgi:hypothetical protein
MHSIRWLSFAVLIALLSRAGVGAVAPEQTFNQLYGSRLKLVGTAAQKVEFSKQLLKDASDLGDDKPLQALLCTKAYDLAMADPQGYPVALDAMALLAKVRPDLKPSTDDKILAVLERQLRAGPMPARRIAADAYLDRSLDVADAEVKAGNVDHAMQLYQKAMPAAQLAGKERANEVLDRMKAIHLRQAAEKSESDLKARLARDPQDDKAASDLTRLLLLDFDDPSQAGRYVAAAQDAELSRRVGSAAKNPGSISDEQCLDLAAWYRTQGVKANETETAIALGRSKLYYQQFLKVHLKEDSSRLGAKMALAQVMEDLGRVHPPGAKQVVDLIALIDPQKDAVGGKWSHTDAGIECAAGGLSKLAIPYLPPQEYDYRVSFKRVVGTAVFLVMTDRNKSFVWVACAWDGITSGFELIGGKEANANATTTKLPQINDLGPHTAVIRVRTDSVSAYLDGTLVGRYFTDASDLGMPEALALDGYALGVGLGASNGPTQFTTLELVEVSGKGRALPHRK